MSIKPHSQQTGRVFITLVGIDAEQDITKTAVSLVRHGYAVVPVTVGGKAPVCTLTAREITVRGSDHDCAFYHATTDDKEAQRVFARLGKNGARYNLGIVAGPSRLVIVDADTAAEVQAFINDWAQAEGDETILQHTPTVRTPGTRDDDGQWLHKDGGHFYFEVPEGERLPYDVKHVLKAPGGYDVKWGMSMVVAPPSVRPEGRYVPTGDVLPCPPFLLDKIHTHITEVTERRQARVSLTPNDDVAAWATSVTWDQLLAPRGWSDTGKLDKCACPIWTKPGGGRTSYKSATAHEPDCERYDNVEGHGPLHLWTTEPPAELEPFVLAGKQTITKLQFVAATEYGGDVGEAMTGLGIKETVDLYGWLEGADDRSADEVSDASAPGLLTADDSTDAQWSSTSASTNEDTESPSAASSGADESGGQQAYAEVLESQMYQVMKERGIPLVMAKEIKPELMKAELRHVVAETQRRTQAARNSDISTWLPSGTFADDFVNGAPEGAGPTVLHRTDGKALLYRGRVNTIVARRAAGKTWAGIAAVADVLQAGGKALYFDMEDARTEWRARFHAIGVDIDSAVRGGRAVWVKPEGMPQADMDVLLDYAGQFDLVVFDVMNRLTIRIGGDPDVANQQVMWLYDNLFDPLAARDTCVLVLDHPNRKGQKQGAELDDLSPGGGAAKMNNASGHVIAMIPTTPFTRERAGGVVRMVTLKDRCGHFEEGADVARLVGALDVRETLFMRLSVDMPGQGQQQDEDQLLLQKAKDRILVLLDKHGEASKRDLQSNISEKPRQKFSWALEELVAEGQIIEDNGRYRRADADDH